MNEGSIVVLLNEILASLARIEKHATALRLKAETGLALLREDPDA